MQNYLEKNIIFIENRVAKYLSYKPIKLIFQKNKLMPQKFENLLKITYFITRKQRKKIIISWKSVGNCPFQSAKAKRKLKKNLRNDESFPIFTPLVNQFKTYFDK